MRIKDLGKFAGLQDITAKTAASGGGSANNFAVNASQKRSHSLVFTPRSANNTP